MSAYFRLRINLNSFFSVLYHLMCFFELFNVFSNNKKLQSLLRKVKTDMRMINNDFT